MALLTGFDGGVVSNLRGVGAWLAALSESARQELIERDPVGVVSYGDAHAFSAEYKEILLRALGREDSRLDSVVWTESALGAVAARGMEPAPRKILERRNDHPRTLVAFVLYALKHGERLPSLAECLIQVVYRDNRRAEYPAWALEAFVHGVLDANAVLHPAPEPFSPQELVEAALPGAWKEGKTNGIALAQALSRSRGTALPWGLVRDAIAASAASRWLRLATGSSLVNCRYEEAGSLVLERPVDESQRYTVTPATRGAVLDGAQIQDLADQIPQLLAASAGADLRFRVQVDLAGELSRENRAVLDELLVEISEDLRPDS